MSLIVEINEDGTVKLPDEVLAAIYPKKRFVVQVNPDQGIILAPADPVRPFWQTATPQERADRLLQWAASHQNGVNLPDKATHRDTIYD